jgi:hypothetical protein
MPMRAALALILALAAAPAAALQLYHRDTIVGYRAASLAWDAWLCGLWVANESDELTLLSPGGREITRITVPSRSVRSLTVERDGLLVHDGWGSFQRIDRAGQARGAPFRMAGANPDTEGLHLEPDGSLLIVGDDPAMVQRFAPGGAEVLRLDGMAMEPLLPEPQGIERDPLSGNILVVDDAEGGDRLFELSPEGAILSVTSLRDWGFDAEGVAVQPGTGTLFVGYDSGRRIAIFDWVPTRRDGAEPLETGPDCAVS